VFDFFRLKVDRFLAEPEAFTAILTRCTHASSNLQKRSALVTNNSVRSRDVGIAVLNLH
jgi:hypothetical protein